MGQADEEVRASAHLLAPSVTEHGVAVALRAAVDGFAASTDGPPGRA
jgi:hydroxymethylpyrimidine pyrophosphatase-like HAD family hydrolase